MADEYEYDVVGNEEVVDALKDVEQAVNQAEGAVRRDASPNRSNIYCK